MLTAKLSSERVAAIVTAAAAPSRGGDRHEGSGDPDGRCRTGLSRRCLSGVQWPGKRVCGPSTVGGDRARPQRTEVRSRHNALAPACE